MADTLRDAVREFLAAHDDVRGAEVRCAYCGGFNDDTGHQPDCPLTKLRAALDASEERLRVVAKLIADPTQPAPPEVFEADQSAATPPLTSEMIATLDQRTCGKCKRAIATGDWIVKATAHGATKSWTTYFHGECVLRVDATLGDCVELDPMPDAQEPILGIEINTGEQLRRRLRR